MEDRRFGAAAICLLLLVVAGCAGGHHRPAAPRALPERPEGVVHVVRAGQTLWRIARAYGLPTEQLAEANGIEDPTKLEIGQRLFIPGAAKVLEVPPYVAPPLISGWIWPVETGRVLSTFGSPRRTHRHTGIDIGGRSGQSVLASRAGRVVYSGAGMRGYGKTVILDHGEGLHSLYAHNSALLVRVGQTVDRGESIAKLGRTGNATTDHCHFEIRRNDVPVDPLPYLDSRSRGSQ